MTYDDGEGIIAFCPVHAAAPKLLDLVRSYQHSCEDRIAILKEERAELCGDETDDIDDQIGHWSVLLEKCNNVLDAVKYG